MGAISSINFKKSNAIQTRHNDRDLKPNYLISDSGCEVNRKHREALKLRNQIIKNAIETYNEKKSEKAPKFKAKSYEWSAVVNIKSDTTMQDLERLAEHFEQKYGFQCYQIAIHRDEGHINDNDEKEINHHAHLEFITLDKNTGKSMFRADLQRPKALSKIQDEVAEILGMERGQDKRISKRERIEPRKYAQMKEQERKEQAKLKAEHKQELEAKDKVIQDLNQVIQDKDQELENEKLSKKQLKERIEVERKAMIAENNKKFIYIAEDYKKLRELKEKQDITITELKAEIEKIKQEAQEREAQKNQEIQALKADKQRFNELLEQDLALKEAYNQALEALKNREKTSNNEKLNENLAEQVTYFLNNFFKDDESIFSKTNTDKIEHSEQDQTHNEEDDLGIDKILIDKNEDKTQEDNKPKIRKYR